MANKKIRNKVTNKQTILLSVVINTLNEAKKLPQAIESVKNLADEIVVCDMQSDDGTAEVAKKMGANVFVHEKTGYVEPARNFAIKKAKHDWILILDADEEISETLANKIRKIIEKPEAEFYRLPRKNIIFGKWIKNSRWWPDYNIRLFKKGRVSWSEVIHSVPMTTGLGADLELQEEMAIIHHHYDNLDEYLLRMNRYSTLLANLKINEGYEFKWPDLVSKPVGEFVSRYFLGNGYKDGVHGLSLALLQSFSELIVYLKIWQSKDFKQKDISLNEAVMVFNQEGKTFNYWKSDARFRETGSFLDRFRRKFKI